MVTPRATPVRGAFAQATKLEIQFFPIQLEKHADIDKTVEQPLDLLRAALGAGPRPLKIGRRRHTGTKPAFMPSPHSPGKTAAGWRCSTVTDDMAMATPAIIGLSGRPNSG